MNPALGSVRFEWPEPLRWKVQIFEALLGTASLTEESIGRPTFVDRGVDPRLAEAASSAGSAATSPGGEGFACASLAIEWLRYAALDPIPDGSVPGDALRLKSDAAPALPVAETRASGSDVLRIAVATGDQTAVYELVAPDIELALARTLTGSLRESPEDPYDICAVDKSGHVSVEISLSTSRLDPSRVSRPLGRSAQAEFRVLTDRGAPPVIVAYPTHDGVVLVQAQSRESLKLCADGSIIGHLAWPRPILGELPFGPDGAVAWGDGLAAYPDVESGYVMYRHQADGDVHIVPLSIRPVTGIWWRDRVFWTCLPRRIDTWTGVASWSPADGLTLALPDLPPLLGLRPDGDRLRLEPGVPRARDGWKGWARGPGGGAWSWTRDDELVPVPVAPRGAASSVASHRRWCATVYPNANLIQLQSTSDARTRWLTVYYPMLAAWLGDSLVLSTGDRELLVFEDLARQVD
jgi:hypothetical protein